MLVDVATVETEVAWVAVARDRTVRALAVRIAEHRRGAPVTTLRSSDQAAAPRAGDEDSGEIDSTIPYLPPGMG
jgi:hypothetical protein